MQTIKDLFCSGRVVLGTGISLTDPGIVEFAKWAGFEFIRIDNEYIPMDIGIIAQMIRTANNIGLPVFVRISHMEDISMLINFGADGITIPDCTLARAKEAVELIKYAPVGNRSMFGSARAIRVSGLPFKQYYAEANSCVSVAVQIEEQQGMDEIDDILALEAIDIVGSGRNDISQAVGVPCEVTHPKVLAFEDIVIQKALKHGKIPLMIASDKKSRDEMVRKGVRALMVRRDESFMLEGMRVAVKELRAE